MLGSPFLLMCMLPALLPHPLTVISPLPPVSYRGNWSFIPKKLEFPTEETRFSYRGKWIFMGMKIFCHPKGTVVSTVGGGFAAPIFDTFAPSL